MGKYKYCAGQTLISDFGVELKITNIDRSDPATLRVDCYNIANPSESYTHKTIRQARDIGNPNHTAEHRKTVAKQNAAKSGEKLAKEFQSLIGTVGKDNAGNAIRIVGGTGKSNMTVEWESDGFQKEGLTFYRFEHGLITRRSTGRAFKDDQVKYEAEHHDPVKQLNGELARVIKYEGYDKCIVLFEECGLTSGNHKYTDFLKGKLLPPTFAKSYGTSFNEFTILYYLEKYGFSKASQGSLKDEGIGKYEVDICNRSMKVAIEYDGAAWHNSLAKIESDKRKDLLLGNAGYKVYRIREKGCASLKDNSVEYILDDDDYFSDSLRHAINWLYDQLHIDEHINAFLQSDMDNIKDRFLFMSVIDIPSEKVIKGKHIQLIRRGSWRDCGFLVKETGKILEHRRLERYLSGSMDIPEDYTGKENTATNGRHMKIISSSGHEGTNITLLLDDVFILSNQNFCDFKRGIYRAWKGTELQCAEIKIADAVMRSAQKADEVIGKTARLSNGQTGKIIEYVSYNDYVVKILETGEILHYENVTINAFESGACSGAAKTHADKQLEDLKKVWIGKEIDTCTSGKIRVLDYKDADHVTVQSIEHPELIRDDVRASVLQRGLKNGKAKVQMGKTWKEEWLNKKIKLNCGVLVRVIECFSYQNVTLQSVEHPEQIKRNVYMNAVIKKSVAWNF